MAGTLQDVKINGCNLKVEILGGDDPSKPVMIVHHGAPGLGSHTEPKASFAAFSDRFRVVVFDARGSGASDLTPPFTHEQWAADVDGLRAWMDVEKIVMAGGSYGGFISMEYAIRYPNRVIALVLRDTAADRAHEQASRANALASDRIEIDMGLFERMMDGRIHNDADFKRAWAHILPLYDHEANPERVKHRTESTPYHFETHNYAFSVNQKSYDIKDKLPQITAPTLITVGRSDWITPVACSETIANLIPNSELVIFEKSGHSPPADEPEKFRTVVNKFLLRVIN